ncbi:MAG: hypothetical protein K2L92_02050 [Muribaculaceae bacterium]|nr:hypothetical protein [Muribaculaceae bacterium]
MLHGEEAMCTECLMTLPRLSGHTADTGIGEALSNGPAPPGFSAVWFRYKRDSPFAELVRSAKYGNRPRQARMLGRAFARELIADYPAAIEKVDVLMPVPMHWFKQIRRGYNQSHEIAAGISDITGIPIGDNLVAVSPHTSQTHRSRQKRLTNVQGTVACRLPAELHDLDICLVDDIVTTGATLSECVLAIGKAGARPASIGALALGAPE